MCYREERESHETDETTRSFVGLMTSYSFLRNILLKRVPGLYDTQLDPYYPITSVWYEEE